MARKRIAIVGAGFAGLTLAQRLKRSDYDIWIFDKHNYHQFQPLMYQVATARLEPSSISFPLRKVFQHCKNVHVRVAKVEKVDLDRKNLQTTIGEYDYDYLVIANGAETNYFGNEELAKYAYPMKSVPEAIQLRNRILQTFEDAIIAPAEQLESLLTFVVVGGGPTGVELAGALAEMKKNVLPRDYPDKDFSKLRVFLLEGLPNLLNAMSDESKKYSRKYLQDLGVIVKTDTLLSNYDGKTVTLKNGETIASQNVIWAAGISGVKLDGIPEEAYSRGNRLPVNRQNELLQIKDVFAIGDIAYMETNKYPKGHPQLAAVANEQAEVLAKNFIRMAKGVMPKPYEYHDKGSMATIGKRKAVVDLPQFSFQGRLAWFTWMFVHLMLILSIKNRLLIFINWAFSYFTNDSTLRVLMDAPDRKSN
ncbi:NAD(P)/FAD-dependent oxidoreductase [Flavobacterium selenitireducens]|uniref:NAD(P)/FAD-dependent oxidoreductase n=1 Tax=Flavobacterium selenitireducens TaxID=2722704 RepID=UPI00168A8647|nr:NAD(P)/FAD-dependent oxidoreductase [Flavobacterium selenitireducens]MBD3583221.1 NAD(P)/FAD-dependent oxidoreductase [Flavobacterium selenitireducens]